MTATPRLYQKAPAYLYAYQFDGTNGQAVAEWCGGVYQEDREPGCDEHRGAVSVDSMQGCLRAEPGDYVIKANGHFYVATELHFRSAYQEVATQ